MHLEPSALARMLEECPTPVLRVGADGVVAWANEAAGPILAEWGCGPRERVPASWATRFALIAASGAPAEVPTRIAGRMLNLRVHPDAGRDHVVIYGRQLPPDGGALALHPDPILEIDTSGAVVRANPGAAPLLSAWSTVVGERLPEEVRLRAKAVTVEQSACRLAVDLAGDGALEVLLVPGDQIVYAFGRRVEGGTDEGQLGSAILANMSHELRTPLNAIVGYAELMADELCDRGDHTLLDDLKKITTSADTLRRMIGDLLEVARIEAGRSPLQVERFELGDLVDDVALTLAPKIEANGSALAVALDLEPPWVEGDAGKVRRVLSILVENAAKFTRDGQVSIEARRESDRFRLVVQDTGIGMDGEQLARLFRPFQQGDASASRQFGGSGLGLAIVRVLVEQMLGRVSVQSEPGRGTSFVVDLPARLQGGR